MNRSVWCLKQSTYKRTFLQVQWLRLCSSTVGGTISIFGHVIKITHVERCAQNNIHIPLPSTHFHLFAHLYIYSFIQKIIFNCSLCSWTGRGWKDGILNSLLFIDDLSLYQSVEIPARCTYSLSIYELTEMDQGTETQLQEISRFCLSYAQCQQID